MTLKCQGFFGAPWQALFITEAVASSQTMLKKPGPDTA
jgi:hypothetical protein